MEEIGRGDVAGDGGIRGRGRGEEAGNRSATADPQFPVVIATLIGKLREEMRGGRGGEGGWREPQVIYFPLPLPSKRRLSHISVLSFVSLPPYICLVHLLVLN